jgi:hypothetical protein
MTKSVDVIPNKLRLETVKDSPYWRNEGMLVQAVELA